jgi:arylformamidase
MIGKRMTRRGVLGSAAALVATPVFAEDCQVGPPPHDKGPPV